MSLEKVEKIHLELLLEFASSLPASPRVFARLSKLIENEDTALDYISSLVKMDPGLAAQILRVTNSAYFGATIKVNDVETAISRIGFREVRKILSMVLARDCFYQALPAYGLTATEFADEAIDTAVASEVLAKRVGLDLNAPYVAGLLMRIGKLAINLYLERMDQMADLTTAAPGRPLEETELELLGMTHLRVGAELLRNWQFEIKIWQPIKNQGAPAQSTSFELETAILTLASWVARQISQGYDFEAELPASTKWALGALGFDALNLPMLIDDTRFEINDRKNLLSLLL